MKKWAKKNSLVIYKNITWIFISLGALLRFRYYLFNSELWYDEAWFSSMIIHKSLAELLQPMHRPLGFVLIQKFMTGLFGNSEYALRLFPFLCGIASLFLFYKMAKHLIEARAVAIAVGLFALSNSLIYSSCEVKLGSCDVVVAILLYQLAIHMQSKRLSVLRTALFGFAGAAAIWLSYTATFILAGIGATLLLFSLAKKEWAKAVRLLIVCVIWLFSFSVNYFLFLYEPAHAAWLVSFWKGAFMPFPPRAISDVEWFIRNFFAVFSTTLSLSLKGIGALVFIIGCITMFLNKKRAFFMLISPLFFCLAASGFHKYPFAGHMLLFAVPALLLFIGEGTEEVRAKTINSSPVIGATLIILLFSFPLYRAGYNFIKPYTRTIIKPAMNYMKEHKQKGDTIYVYHGAANTFKYYAGDYGFPDNSYIRGVGYAKGLPHKKTLQRYIDDLNKLRGKKRVWILFSPGLDHGGVNEKVFFLNYLDTIGTRLDSFSTGQGAVYLYNLNK